MFAPNLTRANLPARIGVKQPHLSARIGVKSWLGLSARIVVKSLLGRVGAKFEASKPVSQDWGKVVVGRFWCQD